MMFLTIAQSYFDNYFCYAKFVFKYDQLKEDSKLTFQKKYHKDHSHLHASRKVSFCYRPWALL